MYGGLFVGIFGFRSKSLFSSDVTGTVSSQTRWLVIFPTSSEYLESPLKKWCREHNVAVVEKTMLVSTNDLMIFGDMHGTFPWPPISKLTLRSQADYVAKEDDRAIRRFLTDMMTAPDEAAREKLVERVRQRVVELARISR